MKGDGRLNENTGLYTQSLFEVLYAHEIARTQRYPSPLVLMRIGISSRLINDPDVFDSASLSIAHLLNSGLRQVDVPAHYGTDYMILLPATDEMGGLVVGQRLLERLRGERTTRDNRKYTLEAYIGLAAHPGGPTASGQDILAHATRALDEARLRGANTLVNYRELAVIRS